MTPTEKSEYFRQLALKRKNPSLPFKNKKKAQAAQKLSVKARKQNAKEKERAPEG